MRGMGSRGRGRGRAGPPPAPPPPPPQQPNAWNMMGMAAGAMAAGAQEAAPVRRVRPREEPEGPPMDEEEDDELLVDGI